MKLSIWISSILIAASIIAIIAIRPPAGIDFVGGSIIELKTTLQPNEVNETISETLDISATVNETGADTVQIRTTELSTDEHTTLLSTVNDRDPDATEERFDVIGPSLSQELLTSAVAATALGALGILLYLAYMFRSQSRTISSWAFGSITVIVLIHDLLLASGAYAIYSYVTGASIDMLFVTALLAILGYSVNDTIVVSNRIVSDMRNTRLSFPELVHMAVRKSATRSINTSVTTLLVLVALLLFGGEATRPFVFTLTTGVIIGTYSSLMIGPPLLVAWQQRKIQK